MVKGLTRFQQFFCIDLDLKKLFVPNRVLPLSFVYVYIALACNKDQVLHDVEKLKGEKPEISVSTMKKDKIFLCLQEPSEKALNTRGQKSENNFF